MSARAATTLAVLAFLAGCGEDAAPRDDDAGNGGPDAGADAGSPFDYDCDDLPQPPFEGTWLPQTPAGEDLAFDDAGNVFGGRFGLPGVFKSTKSGPPELFSPMPEFSNIAGVRFLPGGDLVVAAYGQGAIVRIDREGVQHVVLAGLSYPNGVTVDLDGLVYFSEQDGGRVSRLDAYTGEREVLVEPGTIESPNGVSFSPDYRVLYIGEYSATRRIWTLPIAKDGTPGTPEVFATLDEGAGLDGLAVDACGNLYVTAYGGYVYRLRPDGSEAAILFNGNPEDPHYMPNMEWGSGIGGWDPLALYLPDGWPAYTLVEMYVGVPAKPRPFP